MTLASFTPDATGHSVAGPKFMAVVAGAMVVLATGLCPAVTLAQPAGASQVATSGSQWSELSPAQKTALKPLAPNWSGMSDGQRRKWIALSQNFASLPPAEQAKMHGRMREWASLSTTQRTQARQNFAETKQLTPEQKKSKWEAYQALSPQEKQKLASGAPAKPAGAAPTVTPAPSQQLANVPPSRSETKGQQLSKSKKPKTRNSTALAEDDDGSRLPAFLRP